MAFTRTSSGLAEKWRFHKEPTVWLEGPTDLFFYAPISDGISCRFQSFHGSANAKALISALKEHNYPYLVVLDGDYSILNPKRSPHRRVIVLPRYSYENLLWEPDAINTACLRHAHCGEKKDLTVSAMAQTVLMLKKEFLPALVLDVAARRMETPPNVLPDHIDELLHGKTTVTFNPDRLKEIVNKARKTVDAKFVKESKSDITSFLQDRCISHLIRGHLLFGLLRRIFLQAANKERGSKSVSPNNALLQMFSDAVWRCCKEGDHKRLKRKFRSKLRELLPFYP